MLRLIKDRTIKWDAEDQAIYIAKNEADISKSLNQHLDNLSEGRVKTHDEIVEDYFSDPLFRQIHDKVFPSGRSCRKKSWTDEEKYLFLEILVPHPNDIKIVNATAHAINFQKRSGRIYKVEPCGVILSAMMVEEIEGEHESGPQLISSKFVPTVEGEKDLSRLERENPGKIIVGSIIAAQTYPGRVFSLVMVPGCERVPAPYKRAWDYKFATWGGVQ